MGMGEAVDTIPSILNKCLFVSPPDRPVYYKLTLWAFGSGELKMVDDDNDNDDDAGA